MSIRILLVDDHPIMCVGLRLALEQEPGMTVAGQALDAPTALARFRELAPDIVIMDVDLGEADGINLAAEIFGEAPHARIIVFSGLPELDSLDRALKVGIRGYLLKANGEAELIRAIRAVHQGGFYLCDEALNVAMGHYRKLLTATVAPAKPLLTDRELEVLKLTAEGFRVKDIAVRLDIGIKTVDTHRSNLLSKLSCSSVAELTRYAIREGIIAP